MRLNETLGEFLQYFGVMYGLLLGLLAVATYQNHTDVEKAVSSEASSLAALYRDVTAYPEPQRSELKTLLTEYTRYVIEEAWPLQRQGLVPSGGVKRIADFQASLVSIEPQTKAQEALHERPCGSSTGSSSTEGPGSIVSTPVSPRSFGIRSGSGR